MALIDAVRRGHQEARRLIDAPGHANEEPEAIAHCYLALIFQWSAYLYLESGVATVLFWEGDLIDLWSRDSQLTKAVLEVVRDYGLRMTGDDPA